MTKCIKKILAAARGFMSQMRQMSQMSALNVLVFFFFLIKEIKVAKSRKVLVKFLKYTHLFETKLMAKVSNIQSQGQCWR